MCVQRPRPPSKNGIAWQILFCLALLSFLCRALIPAGYMPDHSGEQDGFFSVTLCSPSGTPTTVWMSLNGQDEAPSSDEHADLQKCPYALVLSQLALPGTGMTSVDIFLTHQPVIRAHSNHTLPPMPALGPPLGSRAPPKTLLDLS